MTTHTLTTLPPKAAKEYLIKLAKELAYAETEITAGITYADRAARRDHPPGEWDRAGRFYASEHTVAVADCRPPSANWPYSQMKAARTAAHCAEVFAAVSVTHVRRIGTAYNKLLDGVEEEKIVRLLTKGVRKRKAELKQAA